MVSRKKFLLNLENFSATMEEISQALKQNKASHKEINAAQLVLEETFMRMRDKGGAENAVVTLQKRWGSLGLKLESAGKWFNPLMEATDYNEDEVDFYRVTILKANRSKMGYARKGDLNIVTISVHERGNTQIYRTLLGMVLGVICGLIMDAFLAQDLIKAFDASIVKSFRSMFLHALNMMIAPVIFFSVISGVTSITNAADIGRIGGKLMGIYALTTLIASFFSVIIGATIFGGNMPQVGVAGEAGEAASFSLLSMFVGLVPKNLVDPIINGEMLQIIFVAVVFGICINKLGDKVKILHDFIDAMNNFCLRMITMIVAFIPFVAFLSMASLIINVGLDSVFVLGELVLGQLFGSLLMIGIYVLLLMLIGRLNPLPFIKKLPSFIPIPLSTSSSNATMPFTLKFCSEKMGISQKLSSFSIPVGATVNMDGGCFYLSIASIMLARMYGVELDFDVLFTVFVTVVALSIGAPGVPGGAFVCLASIVAALGLPVEATAIILGIDPICSMLRATLNAVGDIAATTALAKTEHLIDEEVYMMD